MRVKRKKHAGERMLACGDVVINEPALLGEPDGLFGTSSPLYIEIGCGKGDFLLGNAQKNPDKKYIGFERITDVLVVAAEKLFAAGVENARVCCIDASKLAEYLPPHSVDGIFLNFSDPWPKKGHYKRRLTYRGFLEIYRQLLVPGGFIRLKTDNLQLFEFSLEELGESGFELHEVTYDLHAEYPQGNIETEYEKRFSAAGQKINALTAYELTP